MSPTPLLAVTETGGTLGIGARRVLLLGVPFLHCLTVQELRAVLAHELGHYLGGDTRLCGVIGYTEASFHSVLTAVTHKPGDGLFIHVLEGAHAFADMIGQVVVGRYVRLYMRVTRPAGRRQELAADALAARLAGRAAVIRALEKTSVFDPLYSAYLSGSVATVVANDVVPSDLSEGFRVFRKRLHERGTEQAVADVVRSEKTDPFDTHPALTERVSSLETVPEGPTLDDERSAVELFADPKKLEEWLVRATGDLISGGRIGRATQPARWSKIHSKILPRAITARANELEPVLQKLHPKTTSPTSLFTAVVRSVWKGGGAKLALRLEPRLLQLPERIAEPAGRKLVEATLGTLFYRALLQHGGTIASSLGEVGLVFDYRGEHVEAGEIVRRAMTDAAGAAALTAWTERLEREVRGTPSGESDLAVDETA